MSEVLNKIRSTTDTPLYEGGLEIDRKLDIANYITRNYCGLLLGEGLAFYKVAALIK